jgi:hypothetical protein
MRFFGAPGKRPIVAPGSFISCQVLVRPKVSTAGYPQYYEMRARDSTYFSLASHAGMLAAFARSGFAGVNAYGVTRGVMSNPTLC